MSEHLLSLRESQRNGVRCGIYSVCSASPLVLWAAMAQARDDGSPLLVEATCNQVNQLGGYTGMTPAAFRVFVLGLGREAGLPEERIILGGDHLGPNPWRAEGASAAMDKAAAMVDAYASAGFRKIHLDASMRCAGDPDPLPEEAIAERAAALCLRAERACQAAGRGRGPAPVYVIGTEVPPPGGAGAHQDAAEAQLSPTPPADLERTLDVSRAAFARAGLAEAWDRVVAVVVQPGVEFSDFAVHAYDRARAEGLRRAIAGRAPWMYEAHSTDYQRPQALSDLVEDRFAILKVGPWLTFACREALFALEDAARDLHAVDPSRPLFRLRETLDRAMLKNPLHWRSHHRGTPAEQALARRFSYSDRGRYYFPDPEVDAEVTRLLDAMNAPLPAQLVSQHFPLALDAVLDGSLAPDGRSLVTHAVRRVLRHYAAACRA
jgi:D-tagatose-1,6-bisphosphate aldolase subunit GatZ/KbaZ